MPLKVYLENNKAIFDAPSDGDSGFDLRAINTHFILPDEQRAIETGVYVAIPEQCVGIIRDRSSMALKHVVVQGGVIDPSYRGELIVLLRNLGRVPFEIRIGDKIAQMVVSPCITTAVKVRSLSDLGDTMRGDKGFGSTGR
jgi:dUTP pyrophosphatase